MDGTRWRFERIEAYARCELSLDELYKRVRNALGRRMDAIATLKTSFGIGPDAFLWWLSLKWRSDVLR
jgi:hypothetical protein